MKENALLFHNEFLQFLFKRSGASFICFFGNSNGVPWFFARPSNAFALYHHLLVVHTFLSRFKDRKIEARVGQDHKTIALLWQLTARRVSKLHWGWWYSTAPDVASPYRVRVEPFNSGDSDIPSFTGKLLANALFVSLLFTIAISSLLAAEKTFSLPTVFLSPCCCTSSSSFSSFLFPFLHPAAPSPAAAAPPPLSRSVSFASRSHDSPV